MQLALKGIGHRFGNGPWLFRDLDFSFDAGEVCALVGPSGSGKSTLLSLIAGWVSPSEGSIDRNASDKVAWVFQNPHGVPHRTALDHVTLPLIAQGFSIRSAREASHELLERFSLDGVVGRPFRDLSGGEAQRLMLARSLASKPQILLIDEPTAQLDQTTAQTVNAAISSAATEDCAIIVATHDSGTREACTALLDLASVARSR